MARINKSDPAALQKLRDKVEKEKKEKQSTIKSESYASNKSNTTAVQKLREKVLKENPDYKSKTPVYNTPSSRGGTPLDTGRNTALTGKSAVSDTTKETTPKARGLSRWMISFKPQTKTTEMIQPSKHASQ